MPGCNAAFLPDVPRPVACNRAAQTQSIADPDAFHTDALDHALVRHHANPDSYSQSRKSAVSSRNHSSQSVAISHAAALSAGPQQAGLREIFRVEAALH